MALYAMNEEMKFSLHYCNNQRSCSEWFYFNI